MDRRSVLRAVPVAVGVGAAGCLGSLTGGGGPDDGGFEEYVANANGYEGPVDRTGEDGIEVTVGAGSKGVAFDPPAVVASQGVTVTWTWSGRGGEHNVVSENGLFGSERASSERYTFTRTLDRRGVYKYYCDPHEGIGMVGAVETE